MFNHLESPLLNSVKSQSQLVKHVLINPSRQLSVKQARLPIKQKHVSTNMSIVCSSDRDIQYWANVKKIMLSCHLSICGFQPPPKKKPLLISGFPPPVEYGGF